MGLNTINNDNAEIIKRFKMSIALLDNIEASLKRKVEGQISDIYELENKMNENIELFKSICRNIINHVNQI